MIFIRFWGRPRSNHRVLRRVACSLLKIHRACRGFSFVFDAALIQTIAFYDVWRAASLTYIALPHVLHSFLRPPLLKPSCFTTFGVEPAENSSRFPRFFIRFLGRPRSNHCVLRRLACSLLKIHRVSRSFSFVFEAALAQTIMFYHVWRAPCLKYIAFPQVFHSFLKPPSNKPSCFTMFGVHPA